MSDLFRQNFVDLQTKYINIYMNLLEIIALARPCRKDEVIFGKRVILSPLDFEFGLCIQSCSWLIAVSKLSHSHGCMHVRIRVCVCACVLACVCVCI